MLKRTLMQIRKSPYMFGSILKIIPSKFRILNPNKSRVHCLKSVQIRSFFWSVFSCIRTEYGDLLRKSCIRTEYGDLLRKSPYSVRIQENTDQKKLRIWTLFIIYP